MASQGSEGEVNGLAERLRSVDGVEEVRLEVTDGGIEAIHVRLTERTNEGFVLDEIRRLLAAYGLRSRRPQLALTQIAPPSGEEPVESAPGPVEVRVTPVGEGLEVRLAGAGRAVIRRAEATRRGAAAAMAEAVAAWWGSAAPEVGGIELDRVGGYRVVTVVLLHPAGPACAGAAIVESDLHHALHRAVTAAFPEL
ncbi:MAG: hypothetical protein R6X29_11320 [Acidimicrobiia bacterium]|jgi:hypothetical protein